MHYTSKWKSKITAHYNLQDNAKYYKGRGSCECFSCYLSLILKHSDTEWDTKQ